MRAILSAALPCLPPHGFHRAHQRIENLAWRSFTCLRAARRAHMIRLSSLTFSMTFIASLW